MSDININDGNLKFKTYSRLLSQFVPSSGPTVDVIQTIKDNIRTVSASGNFDHFGSGSDKVSVFCRADEIPTGAYCSGNASFRGVNYETNSAQCFFYNDDDWTGPVIAHILCLGDNN